MTDEPKEEFVVVYGELKTLRPDMRQYRQNSIEVLLDNVKVAVAIPKVPEYFHTYDPIVLTPKGLKFVQDQFDNIYGVELPKDIPDEEFKEKSEKKVEKAAETSDDGWDTDATFDEEKKAEPNKPDTEVWNEKDESW